MGACKMKYMGCKGIAAPGEFFCPECLALLQQVYDENQQKMEAAGLTEKDLEYNPKDIEKLNIDFAPLDLTEFNIDFGPLDLGEYDSLDID